MFFKIICVIKMMLLKLKYGSRLQINGHMLLRKTQIVINKGRLTIKGTVSFHENTHIGALCGGDITISGGTSFNRNCNVVSRGLIKIGKQCSFGPNVCLYDHDHCFDHNGKTEGFKTGEIVIGDNCWIAAGVIILRNTHIGEGCVIGAGAVVKGDIPPHSLVVAENRNLTIKEIKDK